MKLICVYCREFIKKKDTKITTVLERVGLTNVHVPCRIRSCNKCGNLLWDEKLEKEHLKLYTKAQAKLQKQIKGVK